MYDTITNMWYWSYSLDYIDKNLCIKKSVINDMYKYIKKNSQIIEQQDFEDITFRLNNNSFYMSTINNIIPLTNLLLYFEKSLDYILIYYDENKKINIFKDGDNVKNIYIILVKKILRIL